MKSDCHVSERLQACCDVCREWPERLHMPEEIHGWYCARCCPACKLRAQEQQAQPTHPDSEHQAA